MSGDSFNFGTVSGPVNAGSGTQYNVGGNAHVNTQTSTVPAEVLQDLADLRSLIDRLGLDAKQTESAAEALAHVERSAVDADPAEVKSGWTRLTEILHSAGALATAGVTVAEPLRRISQWVITLA